MNWRYLSINGVTEEVRSWATAEHARQICNYALRSGRIIKPTACEECGASVKLQAHHYDYALPFNVKWLCHKCHGKTRSSHPKTECKCKESK